MTSPNLAIFKYICIIARLTFWTTFFILNFQVVRKNCSMMHIVLSINWKVRKVCSKYWPCQYISTLLKSERSSIFPIITKNSSLHCIIYFLKQHLNLYIRTSFARKNGRKFLRSTAPKTSLSKRCVAFKTSIPFCSRSNSKMLRR